MININLLPWRNELRKREKRYFMTIVLLFVLGTIFICTCIYYYSTYRATNSGPSHILLNNEIKTTNDQITALAKYGPIQKKLTEQVSLLEAVQYNRFLTLILMNEISQALPKTIYLERIVRTSKDIQLYGTASTNQEISQYITNLQSHPEITNAVLVEAKTLPQDDNSVVIKFQINAQISPKKPLQLSKSNAKT